jgi:hypothetical protein
MSFAIIKANADRPGATAYLDYFLPLVADALRVAPNDTATTEQVRAHLSTAFGLRVPLPVISTLLKRAAKKGYVVADRHVFTRNAEKLAEVDFQTTRQAVLRQQAELVHALVAFALQRYEVQWSNEEAERHLLAVISDRSTDVVAASLAGAPLGVAPPQGSGYIVYRFILECYESKQLLFGYVENIAKGSMLADALYYGADDVRRKPKGLHVYLDTTLVIRALGLNVPAVVESAREVLQLAKAQNCELRIFDHTATEVAEVLDAVSRALRRADMRRPPHGETVNYCLDAKLGAGDVELVIQRMQEKLIELDIHTYPAPKHEQLLGVNELKLQEHLEKAIPYRREEALYRDIDSLTSVFRLRRGQLFPRLEDAGHLFVTSNASLAQASARFFRDEYRKFAAPPCILEHIFATLMWLKEPLRAPSLPRKLVIADCYAAMNPGDALWRTYLQYLETQREARTLSDDDYHLLRYGRDSREILLELTHADVNAVTEGTPGEVLRAAKARLQADAEMHAADERRAKEEAEARARNAEDELRAERASRRLEMRSAARTEAFVLLTPFVLLVMAALAVGTAFGIAGAIPSLAAWRRIVGMVVSTLFGGASLIAMYVGGSVKAVVDKLYVATALRCEERRLRKHPKLVAEITAEIQPPPVRWWGPLTVAAPMLAAVLLWGLLPPPTGQTAVGPVAPNPVSGVVQAGATQGVVPGHETSGAAQGGSVVQAPKVTPAATSQPVHRKPHDAKTP